MAEDCKKSIEHLQNVVKVYRRQEVFCVIAAFCGLGYTAISLIWVWSHDWKQWTDYLMMLVGVFVIVFEAWMVRRSRMRQKPLLMAIDSFKRTDETISYTAKEHHIDQALAALNTYQPGITDQIVKDTIKGADSPDG